MSMACDGHSQITDLRGILGRKHYLGRYLPNLNDLLKNDVAWACSAMREVKQVITDLSEHSTT